MDYFIRLPTSPPPLYSFTSHTFTNCGQTQETGPTLEQCKSEYTPSWTDNTNYFNVINAGTQIWTVPESAIYTIKVAGGSGENLFRPNNWQGNGGAGSLVEANYSIEKGTKLYIEVGHKGVALQNQPSEQGPLTYLEVAESLILLLVIYIHF